MSERDGVASLVRSDALLATGSAYPRRYWECECCGSLLVTLQQDDAAEYQCPQCAIVRCKHGGKYVEVGVEVFCKKANIVVVNKEVDHDE